MYAICLLESSRSDTVKTSRVIKELQSQQSAERAGSPRDVIASSRSALDNFRIDSKALMKSERKVRAEIASKGKEREDHGHKEMVKEMKVCIDLT